MTEKHDHTLPLGIFPFHMTDSFAKAKGLKNGSGRKDLVPLKSFSVSVALEEIAKNGFSSAFEPCQEQLKACDLKEFFVACDPSLAYGEMFLLLYTPEAIEKFKQKGMEFTTTFNESASRLEDEIQGGNDRQLSLAAEDAKRNPKLNEVHEEKLFVPREYKFFSNTADETVREVENFSVRPRRALMNVKIIIPISEASRRLSSLQDYPADSFSFPPYCTGVKTLVKCRQDKCATNIPVCLSVASQTMKYRMVNKVSQYETLQLDSSLIMADEVQMKIKLLLKRTLPTVEKELQKNEIWVKTCAYAKEGCCIQEECKNKLDLTCNDLKQAGCFNDLTYSNGKAILSIDWHPYRKNILAISVSNDTLSAQTKDPSKTTPNYILLWKLDQQKRPFMVLWCPYECCSFRFNPTNPNIAVAGCSNGQIVMWDMKERMLRLEENDKAERGLSGNDKINCDLSPLQPYALSRLEEHQMNRVNDLCWLPTSMHLDSNGVPLSKDNLSGQSFQFITVSGCEISFWDTRFRDIPTGKSSHTLKPRKSGRHEKNDVSKVLHFDWVPIFRSKISHFEWRSRTTPITRLIHLYGRLREASDAEDIADSTKVPCKSMSIYCTTEEGDLALINWNTVTVNTEGRIKSKEAKDSSVRTQIEKNSQLPDVVQWSIQDHFGRIVSLEQSPFFSEILLSVSCWSFHVWNVLNHSQKKPLFISSQPSTIYTVGRWSPSRPGIIILAKVDGSIDVWDFMNNFDAPSKTQSVSQSHITSMLVFQEQQSASTSVAVGDCSGSLTLLNIPMIFSRPQPDEVEEMAKFFQVPM